MTQQQQQQQQVPPQAASKQKISNECHTCYTHINCLLVGILFIWAILLVGLGVTSQSHCSEKEQKLGTQVPMLTKWEFVSNGLGVAS